jgi:hypothetical protein
LHDVLCGSPESTALAKIAMDPRAEEFGHIFEWGDGCIDGIAAPRYLGAGLVLKGLPFLDRLGFKIIVIYSPDHQAASTPEASELQEVDKRIGKVEIWMLQENKHPPPPATCTVHTLPSLEFVRRRSSGLPVEPRRSPTSTSPSPLFRND